MELQERIASLSRFSSSAIPSNFPKFVRERPAFSVYPSSDRAILVNLTLDVRFGTRALARITSLALGTGGIMEVCNEVMAIFAFPNGGTIEFIEEIGLSLVVTRTVVSPRENSISKVNIRFLPV